MGGLMYRGVTGQSPVPKSFKSFCLCFGLCFYLCLCLCPIYTNAGELHLFPDPNPQKTLSAETMPYSQMLHTGIENDTFYLRGRFGVDFPIIGYTFGNSNINPNVNPNINFGITAATNINMRPTSGMKFPVDNFYAVLALHLSGIINKEFFWRLYPVYHVSAHLADGYPSDILKQDVRAVSSEMVRGEGYYRPFGEILEVGVGAGWYYHVCAQKELKYRGDMSILLTSPRAFYGVFIPYVLLRVEDVYQGGNDFGVDASAGVAAMRGKRGFGLSVRYFDRLHSGYYFEGRERGGGVEYTFMR